MSGFTFNGIHCSQYGVEYAPNPEKRWWTDAEFEVYKKDVPWRNGGYWYGTSVNSREIALSCYFEEITIATREKIRRWLARDSVGKLIFDDRPFVYYIVRPGKVVTGNLYHDHDKYSGTFEIEFIAVEPFGYLTRKYNTGTENDGAEDYCALCDLAHMPNPPVITSTSFNIYNPGTEPCAMSLRLSGSCTKPFRFINRSNDTQCVISALPTNNLILDINGETGYVSVRANGSSLSDNGFAYHDVGFIRLEPNAHYYNVPYVAEANGNLYDLTLSGINVDESMLYALIWFYTTTRTATVQAVNPAENKITVSLSSGTGEFMANDKLRMRTNNRIEVQSKNTNGSWSTATSSTLSLSSISVDYNPRIL